MNNRKPTTKTTRPTTRTPTRPTTKTTVTNKTATPNNTTTPVTRTFRYKAMPDIILFLIGCFVAIVIISAVGVFAGGITTVGFVIGAIFILGTHLATIFVNSFNRMTVTKDEIIFRTGWATQKTKSVPTSKIRYCSKTSGVFQRLCGTMTIGITASGDAAEITFVNIENGEEAYKLISQLAIRNGTENSRA